MLVRTRFNTFRNLVIKDGVFLPFDQNNAQINTLTTSIKWHASALGLSLARLLRPRTRCTVVGISMGLVNAILLGVI